MLEAGFGSSGALAWSKVHDDLARITRTCAYSRAGILWSDPRDGGQTGETVADDLKALLAHAGEWPPLVLVGQSLGGTFVMMYTRKYGADVAGVVLVDSAHPDEDKKVAAAGLQMKTPAMLLKLMSGLVWTGGLRLMFGSADADSALLPTTIAAMLKEWTGFKPTLTQAGVSRSFGARPLFVLTAGRLSDEFVAQHGFTPTQASLYQKVWREMQDDLASWSTRSQHTIVADAAHQILEERPARVVAAVRWVVDAVRAP